MKSLVLDACAVVVHLNKEPGWQDAGRLIWQFRARARPMLMSVVNVAEVRYLAYRKGGPAAAVRACEAIRHLGIEVVPVDPLVAYEATHLKAAFPLAFADCFAAAPARLRAAPVVMGDPEFRKFGDRVGVLWLEQ